MYMTIHLPLKNLPMGSLTETGPFGEIHAESQVLKFLQPAVSASKITADRIPITVFLVTMYRYKIN